MIGMYTNGMKTAVSIPDPVFQAAEDLARRLGKSRSELYAEALRRLLRDQVDRDVTEQVNRVLEEDPGADALDPLVKASQREILSRERW